MWELLNHRGRIGNLTLEKAQRLFDFVVETDGLQVVQQGEMKLGVAHGADDYTDPDVILRPQQ